MAQRQPARIVSGAAIDEDLRIGKTGADELSHLFGSHAAPSYRTASASWILPGGSPLNPGFALALPHACPDRPSRRCDTAARLGAAAGAALAPEAFGIIEAAKPVWFGSVAVNARHIGVTLRGNVCVCQ